MVLFGVRSHGRCPSPVPRKASGKMWISTTFWLPSIRKRRLDDAADRDVVRQFSLVRRQAVPRLNRQHRSIDAFDGAPYPHRRRLLLGKGRGCDKQGKARRAERRRVIWSIVILPNSRRSDRLRSEQPAVVMLIPAAAPTRHLCVCLKYLKSGGGCSFLAGIKKPSALRKQFSLPMTICALFSVQ